MSINEVALMSRIISDKSSKIEKLELKKMFIIAMASVPDPDKKTRELALNELEKPFEDRIMGPIIGKNNIISINKQEFFKLMKIDLKKYPDAYEEYYKFWKELQKSSYYDLTDEDGFIAGNFITSAYTKKNMKDFRIIVDPNYMPIFWHLKGGFVKLLTEDIAGFDSKFSMDLYKFIMSHTNKKELDFTTKQLKELFGLSKEDYVYKSGKRKGQFKRDVFEERTILTALKEIDEKCKSIVIFKSLNEKGETVYFTKEKADNGHVKFYKIRYMVKDPYEVVNEEKLYHQVTNDECLKENPRSIPRNKRLSLVVEKEKMDQITKSLYNWLEKI